MTIRIKHKLTDEEKLAIKLSNLVVDLRVDLELVGRYIARLTPTVVYNRFITIAESAQYEKEGKHDDSKYQDSLY